MVSYFGGRKRGGDELTSFEAIAKYEQSAEHMEKVMFIRALASAIRELGINIRVDDSDASAILRATTEFFKSKRLTPRKQEEACKKLAQIVNQYMDAADRIDLNQSADKLCEKLGDAIDKAVRSMGSEIDAINIKFERFQLLDHLRALNAALEIVQRKFEQDYSSASETMRGQVLDMQKESMKIIASDFKRTIEKLIQSYSKLLNPEMRAIIDAQVRETNPFRVLGETIELPKPDRTGESLYNVVNGLAAAYVIDRSLKDLGIATKDFLAAVEKGDDLRKLLFSQVKEGESAELNKAWENLVQILGVTREGANTGMLSEEIVKQLREISGRGEDGCSCSGGDESAIYENPDRAALKRNIVKKKEAAALRGRIQMTVFNEKFSVITTKLIRALDKLAPMIGEQVPISEQLDTFRQLLNRLDELKKRNLYFALSGYFNDVNSRQQRELFTENLTKCANSVETMMKMSEYSAASSSLGEIKSALEELVKHIHEWNDKLMSEGIIGRGEDADDEVVEGGLPLPTIAAEIEKHMPSKTRLTDKWANAIEKFDYYYNISSFKSNLLREKDELSRYGQGYEDVIASAISTLQNKQFAKIKDCTDYLDSTSADPAISSMSTDDKRGLKEYFAYKKETLAEWYRAVQAIDLYLKHFTEGIVGNVGDIQNIKQMLDDIQYANKWFDEAAGNNLAKVFDCFPGAFVEKNQTNATAIDGTTFAQYYLASDKPNIGWNDSASKAHYYLVVANLLTNRAAPYNQVQAVFDASGKLDTLDDGSGKPAGGYARGECLPGNPLNIADVAHITKARKYLDDVFEQFIALKNFMAIFNYIGNKFGGQLLHEKLFMKPIEIYYAFVEYIKLSAFSREPTRYQISFSLWDFDIVPPKSSSVNPGANIAQEYIENKGDIKNAAMHCGLAPQGFNAAGIVPAMSMHGVASPDGIPSIQYSAGANSFAGYLYKDSAVMKQRYFGGFYMSSCLPGYEGEYETEDRLFVLMIKAMSAKILTVIGAYDMLERPYTNESLGTLRAILGGAINEDIPVVKPEYLELYVRGPLLIEYFRDLFYYDDTSKQFAIPNMLEKFAMLPELEGVWSGIIRYMFVNLAHKEPGNYTKNELKQIIRLFNDVGAHYKGDNRAAINDLVREVNRRYGLISKDDIRDYQAELANLDRTRFKDYSLQPQTVDQITTILPDEEDEFTIKRAAPSDRYASTNPVTPMANPQSRLQYKIDDLARRAVYKFRAHVDSKFSGQQGYSIIERNKGLRAKYTFNESIKEARQHIEKTQDNTARFDILINLMERLDKYYASDSDKLVMFHELVVSPLTTLTYLYHNIRNFMDTINNCDIDALEHLINGINSYNDLANGGAPIFRDVPIGFAFVNAQAKTAGVPMSFLQFNSDNEDAFKVEHVYYTQILKNLWLYKTDGVGKATNFGSWSEIYLNPSKDMNKDNNLNTFATISGSLTSAELSREAVKRFCVNRRAVLRTYFDALYSHTTGINGLVQIKFSDVPHIDCSALKELVVSTLSRVKEFISEFRPYLDADLIKTYEEYTLTDNRSNLSIVDDRTLLGSVYNLEKVFIDELFADEEYVCPKHKIAKVHPSRTLEDCYRKIQRIHKSLFRKHSSDFGGAVDKYDNYFDLLSQVSFANLVPQQNVATVDCYDLSSAANVRVLHPLYTYVLRQFDDKGTHAQRARLPAGVTGEFVGASGELKRIAKYTSYETTNIRTIAASDMKDLNGVIFKFNFILKSYMASFYEEPTHKIYGKLVDSLFNGSLNYAIMNPSKSNTIPDMSSDSLTIDYDKAEKPAGILFMSIAYLLRNLFTVRNTNRGTNEQVLLHPSIVDVSDYMKEKYRTLLPIYLSLFKELADRCTYIKTMAEHVRVAARVSAAGTFSKDKEDLLLLIEQVYDQSMLMYKACDRVLKETNDSPKYMELGPGFIEDYKAKTGEEPLMPLSSALLALAIDNSGVEKSVDFTTSEVAVGDQKFKWLYGNRRLLNRLDDSLGKDDYYGPMQLINDYNRKLKVGGAISNDDALTLTESQTAILRYIYNVQSFKSKFEQTYHVVDNAIGGGARGADGYVVPVGGASESDARILAILPLCDRSTVGYDGYYYQPVPHFYESNTLHGFSTYAIAQALPTPITTKVMVRPYAIRDLIINNDLDVYIKNVIEISENTQKADSIARITEMLSGKNPDDRPLRGRAILDNILDLNIVPINVHAMMRDIPLINIYNYAYTCDRMIIETVGVSNRDTADELLKRESEVYSGFTYNGRNHHEVFNDDSTIIKDSRDLFVKLLINPYAAVQPDHYRKFMSKIFVGNSAVGYGRPKFLSDEIFNKVLFGELYPISYEMFNVDVARGKDTADYHAIGINNDSAPEYEFSDRSNEQVKGSEIGVVVMEAGTGSAFNIRSRGRNPVVELSTNSTGNLQAIFGILENDGSKFPYINRMFISYISGKSLEYSQLSPNFSGNRIGSANTLIMKNLLQLLGFLRFNTKLIRNIIFITNICRVLRYKLYRELTVDRNLVLRGHPVIRTSNTEFDNAARASDSDVL